MAHPLSEYYSKQYNARAAIPDHPYIFTRWLQESALVRGPCAGLLGLAYGEGSGGRRRCAGLLDLAYGEASGERLDFFPANHGGAPLLVFIHGGWWRSLDKSD